MAEKYTHASTGLYKDRLTREGSSKVSTMTGVAAIDILSIPGFILQKNVHIHFLHARRRRNAEFL